MIELKDNYQDDVLDSEKNQLRKYNMIQNDDGTVSFIDATAYSQIGDNFGAKDVNDIVARIGEVSKAENIAYDNEKSVQGAIDEVTRTLGYTLTRKNYMPNFISKGVYSGVSYDVNSNKSITLNGTNTEQWKMYLNLVGIADKNVYEEIKGLKDGVEYKLSGCVGGSLNTYGIACVQLHSDGTTTGMDCYDGDVTFTHNKGDLYRSYMFVYPNVTVNNVTISPMISEEGGEYVPYVADVQTQIDSLGEFGFWTPISDLWTPERCYYVKTKHTLTIFFACSPNKEITSTNFIYAMTLDIKGTFGVKSYRETFGTAYSNNGYPVKVSALSDGRLNIERLSGDIGNSYMVYGQITLAINV